MAKKEWQRTCQRCATVWYAPIESKPNRLQIAGQKMQASGGRMTIGGGRRASANELRAMGLQGKRDRIESLERCPACGSQSFTQSKTNVGATPPPPATYPPPPPMSYPPPPSPPPDDEPSGPVTYF